jgi:transposase-like protein
MKIVKGKGSREWNSTQLAILNEDYEEEKRRAVESGKFHQVTLAIIAKRHGLRPTVLKNWRANHLSRNRSA